jgi:hypothetical protein
MSARDLTLTKPSWSFNSAPPSIADEAILARNFRNRPFETRLLVTGENYLVLYTDLRKGSIRESLMRA